MAFDLYMTQYLTGVTESQLRGWSKKGILVPEINEARPMLYSFRDVVALRVIAKFRAELSLQRISAVLRNLEENEFTEHLSEYRFAFDGKSIRVKDGDSWMDIDQQSGQWEFISFEDVYQAFNNFKGEVVPDLLNPAPGIEVDAGTLGGAPRVEGSRIPTDALTELLRDPDTSEEEIREFYPALRAVDLKNVGKFDSVVYGAA
ncbi:DUF433 domain-containing protein [Corynebacterium crudilactis]|uniref:HTH merR-type domain-containing protein n=1 Tax=Corynebacterium crudilactis TaxID=1652495 RepID=A0A172QQZ8_9CORY|nr:DUF433 domain-containing protein [Corynebacterium crudilactis]ANE03102.1 hypothetical protein ccrud_02010 [Corynebacterium crudilactis]